MRLKLGEKLIVHFLKLSELVGIQTILTIHNRAAKRLRR